MNSQDSNPLAVSSRSQSQTPRWTSGSGTRRRSGRGGKSPPRAPRAGSLLALLPLVPDQEAGPQHHAHRVPVEARPQPPLVLIPAQQLLRSLVILLHPVPPMRILHHLLQRRARAEVAPEVAPLPVAALLPDQPTDPPRAVRPHPPAADRHEPPTQPALAAFTPVDGMPRSLALGGDRRVGPLRRRPPLRGHREVAADGGHMTLLADVQSIEEVGVVAVVGVGRHTGVRDAQFAGPVEQ